MDGRGEKGPTPPRSPPNETATGGFRRAGRAVPGALPAERRRRPFIRQQGSEGAGAPPRQPRSPGPPAAAGAGGATAAGKSFWSCPRIAPFGKARVWTLT